MIADQDADDDNPEEPLVPDQDADIEEPPVSVDARGAIGVQVGDNNVQVSYNYTWTAQVAPPPLISGGGRVDSPYRGLNSFGERDAPFFCGRESATTELLALMSSRLAAPSVVVVSGVSGAGKSSLLRAGVLPLLRGNGLADAPGSATWPWSSAWPP